MATCRCLWQPGCGSKHVRRQERDPSMPHSYKALATRRQNSAPAGYFQPEYFGYDFREWVSPYTKGACRRGGIALVLQDWASERALLGPHDPCIAALGRDPRRITNQRIEYLLWEILRTQLSDVYATNVFPFVKPDGMSATVPQRLVNQSARDFTVPELALVDPLLILALGKVAQVALQTAGVECIPLPHPAARGLDTTGHEVAWSEALS